MKLATRYLGFELPHPLIASSSPLSRSIDGIRRLEDSGAAAVVLFSLFEEQLRREQAAYDHLTEYGAESFSESLSYFPEMASYEIGPMEYLELIRAAREAVDIPVIGSLNGVTNEGWVSYARDIEQAGAGALELNVYYLPTGLGATGAEVEERYVEVVRAVADAVSIPVAVKLSPFFSAVGDVARRMLEAGAEGLVLFNRFYQPDFDLETMDVKPNLQLSSPEEMRLPLLWIAVFHGRLEASLAATTGVHSGTDVAKYVLAGADAVMATSSLLLHGPAHLAVLREELERWMDAKGFESVDQIKGSMSQRNVADPEAFERANYLRVLQDYRNPYAA